MTSLNSRCMFAIFDTDSQCKLLFLLYLLLIQYSSHSTLHYYLTIGLTLHSVAECRFFDSKMRPLLLVFKNPDTSAEHKDIRIIFKNGDGKL